MNRKPTPAERKEYASFAKAAFGMRPKPQPDTTKPQPGQPMKDAVNRIFKQEKKS